MSSAVNSTGVNPNRYKDGKFDPNDPYGGRRWVAYRYEPTLVGAAIFTVLFWLTTLYHLFQLYKGRVWYFIPFAIGGIFESLGYIGRIMSHNDVTALNPYIMQSLLLLVAPALYAASIYMVLGRLIILLRAEHISPISTRWLTKIFVAGDVLSFAMQGAGGGIMTTKNGANFEMGEKIIIGGLFIQIFVFGIFVIAAVVFDFRSRKLARDGVALEPVIPPKKYNWRAMLNILYATSILILVRSLIRVIEYLQGNDGYILRNEYFLYVFDAVPMFAVMVLFNIWHPSYVVPGKRQMMNARRDSQRKEEIEMNPRN